MSRNLSKYSILILINVRWWNASAFYAVNIGRILQKNGHKVIIGCKKSYPAYSIAKSYGLDVVPLNFYGYNFFELISNFIKMLLLIKREKIQIINSHRSEDHTFALMAKWMTGVKFILTRGDRRLISSNFLSGLRYKLSDAVIVTCRSIYNQNRKVFQFIKNKVHIIYGSVDEDNFKLKRSKNKTFKKYKLDQKKNIIGIAGRLDDVKDQYTFLKAASEIIKKIKNIIFIITGKEEHIKIRQLKKYANDLGIEKNVKIFPKVNDIPDLINTFNIGVITSLDSETVSRVLLEYMYLKIPVVGTKVNAVGEIIASGINGEVIKPGDYKSLSKHIIKIISNKKRLKRYSENSIKLYKKLYSEDVFLNKYLNVFKKTGL